MSEASEGADMERGKTKTKVNIGSEAFEIYDSRKQRVDVSCFHIVDGKITNEEEAVCRPCEKQPLTLQ